MPVSLDDFLVKEYNYNNYNCSHFVSEVWTHLTGENISEICDAFVNGNPGEYVTLIRHRTKIRAPENPCVVIMQNPNVAPHAGVYVNDRVFHLTENGPKFDDICVLTAFFRLSYYK